jgi:Mrp family chromosome partitioning ATPase
VGFGLVGFGVIRHESRVRRAMSLADVQKNVLGPMAGILPPRGDQSPASADAVGEAMEKTRTHLLQQFGRPGGKVIAVTSALTEEGKAYLAWKLAENFSLSGGRTLLADFDLRSPSLHRELKVENERGVCDVLAGKVDLREILVPQANGLTFLPAGTWTAEVRHGLTPERLEALLHWLRVLYEVVILNTHPLLAVAETVLLCRNSDAVLMSVERNESRLPLVNRAYEKLAAAAPEVLGIVYQGATAEECMN